jgi:uncharacterized delta-60 repeat protein
MYQLNQYASLQKFFRSCLFLFDKLAGVKGLSFSCLLFFVTPAAVWAQGGGLDPLFNTIDRGALTVEGANNDVYSIAVQPDGKIIVGGMFTRFNGQPVNRIARILSDGSLDLSFNPGGSGTDGLVSKILLQPDGKIILTGNFSRYNGFLANRIVRLNADGAIDPGFSTGTGLNAVVNKLLQQPDGKLLLGGNFTSYNGVEAKYLLRLNADGSRDIGFNASTINSVVNDIGLQSDGKPIVGLFSGNFLVRLHTNGVNDNSFQAPTVITSVLALAVQPDNKIIVSLKDGGYEPTRLLRLESTGSIDPAFDSSRNSVVPVASCIAMQPDGKIIIGRSRQQNDAFAPVNRLNTDGSVDASFQYDYLRDIGQTIFALAVQPDGKVLAGESLQSVFDNNEKYPRVDFYKSARDFRINRYKSDGVRDADFCISSNQTGANRTVNAIAHQVDGKIIVGGNFFSFNGRSANYITRLLEDGSIDPGFNAGGRGPDSRVNAIAVQPDGKILVGGLFHFYNGQPVNQLVRLNTNGTLDAGFNYTIPMGIGRVSKILVQTDGKILVSWWSGSSSLAVQRLNEDGSRDMSFNANIPGSYLQSYVFVHALALQPDGKLLVGGSFGVSQSGLSGYRNLVRLNADGTRDLTFNPTAPLRQVGPSAEVYDFALLPNGGILMAGSFLGYLTASNSIYVQGIMRLDANGIPDNSFNAAGIGTTGAVYALSVQSDGKIILGGNASAYNNHPVKYLFRIESNGLLDSSFNAGEMGPDAAVSALSPQPNGQKYVLGGLFTQYNAVGKNYITRFLTNCSPICSIDSVVVCANQLPYTWQGYSYSVAGTYASSVVNSNGCDSSRTLVLQVSASNIRGPADACLLAATGNIGTYEVDAPPGSLYSWTVTQPAQMTILSGAGTRQISIRFEPGFAAGMVYVRVMNTACGINVNRSLSINRSIPAMPVAIDASASSICTYIGTSNTVLYRIARVSTATAYNWTTGAGTLVTHPNGTGINDTVIAVRYLLNFTSSAIAVQAVNACGVSGIRSLSIQRDPPGIPGLISGSSNVCNNLLTAAISGGPYPHGTYTDYTVPYVPDVNFIWTTPTPYIIGNGTNYISVGLEAGFSSGTISVQARNGCGTSAARNLEIRTVGASAPGSIHTTQLSACPVRRYVYSVANLPANADSIIWMVPGGGVIETGQGSTSITVTYPASAILGYVTAQGVNRCSMSSMRRIHLNMPACATSLMAMINSFNSFAENGRQSGSLTVNWQAQVFPNPSITDFTIQLTNAGNERICLIVMDVTGRIISKQWYLPKQKISFGSNLQPGTYLIQTIQGSNKHTMRVVKS